MKLRSHLLAAVAAVAAAIAMPASAQSHQYVDCKRDNTDNQIVGGVLGAVVGGVAGSQIAGRGERTEGSVIGAIAGAAAGVAIGDERRKCAAEYRATNGFGTTHSGGYVAPSTTVYGGSVNQVHHRGHNRNRNYYGGHRGYDRGFHGGGRLADVRYRIDALKAERRDLKRRSRYDPSRWIDRRRDELKWEIKRLKEVEDRLERRRDRRRDYRRDNYYYGY